MGTDATCKKVVSEKFPFVSAGVPPVLTCLPKKKTLATWYFTTALSAARFVVALKDQVISFFDGFMSLCATLIFKSP